SALAAMLLRDEQAGEPVLDQPLDVLPRVSLLAVERLGERRKVLVRDALRHGLPARGLGAQGGLPDHRHGLFPRHLRSTIDGVMAGLRPATFGSATYSAFW